MSKKIAMIVLALFVLVMTAGCRHTAHRFGEDVEAHWQENKRKNRLT